MLVLTLLVANGFNRIQPRSLDRRINSENQSYRYGDKKRKNNGRDGNDGGPSGEPGDQTRHIDAEDYAEASANEREDGASVPNRRSKLDCRASTAARTPI